MQQKFTHMMNHLARVIFTNAVEEQTSTKAGLRFGGGFD